MKFTKFALAIAAMTLTAGAMAAEANITPSAPAINACAKGALRAMPCSFEEVDNEQVLAALHMKPAKGGCWERLGDKGRRWALGWAAVVTACVALVLIVNGWETAMLARMLGLLTEGHLEWPTWWLMLLMPVGGALLLLATVESLWRAITGQVLTFKNTHGVPGAQDTP